MIDLGSPVESVLGAAKGAKAQKRNDGISDAVKREVKKITERNRNESEQRLVEVAVI